MVPVNLTPSVASNSLDVMSTVMAVGGMKTVPVVVPALSPTTVSTILPTPTRPVSSTATIRMWYVLFPVIDWTTPFASTYSVSVYVSFN